MISGVNVGASVGKDKKKEGEEKGQGKHHDIVEPLMYFTIWIELTGVSEDSFHWLEKVNLFETHTTSTVNETVTRRYNA